MGIASWHRILPQFQRLSADLQWQDICLPWFTFPVDRTTRDRLQAFLEKKESPARRQDSKLRRKVEQILRNETKVRGRDKAPESDGRIVFAADVAPPSGEDDD